METNIVSYSDQDLNPLNVFVSLYVFYDHGSLSYSNEIVINCKGN